MEKNNQQIFLQKYKVFEDKAKIKYSNMTDMLYLERRDSLKDYHQSLRFFRYIRNILSHDGKIGTTPVENMLHITGAMLAELDNLTNEILAPAINKAIHIDKIIYHTKNDKVMEAVHDMVERNYTHCPILSDGRIIGLFGENTLFEIMDKGIIINKDTTFGEIIDKIEIKNSKVARSVPLDITIPDCKQRFTWAIEKNERLDILFFTEDGTYNTPLKGLITIWDMPAINHASQKESQENNY